MVDIPFAIQSYKDGASPHSSQRTVNAYATIHPSNAKTKSRVKVTGGPGIREWAECGDGPVRALIEIGSTAYAVSGGEFYEIDENGTSHLRGSGISGIAPVSIDGTETQIAIVNGSLGYVYTIATKVLSQISDADFQSAASVAVLNSVFVYDWLGTNKFFISATSNANNYDALDYATAEASPDPVVCVQNRNGTLMIFGAHSIEAWDHTGASDFPFTRIKGATVDRGIAGPLATTNEDSSRFFLGDDLVFYRLNGLQLRRASTHPLEEIWQKYSTVDDAICFPLPINGHKFLCLTFPTENATFIYDIATDLWHERVSWDPSGIENRWRINCSVSCYNRVLVGDNNSGKVGILDSDTFTEFGNPIITTLVSPPLYRDGQQMSVPAFEVDIETGVGLANGQGSDPQIMMDFSLDGGKTYTSAQLWQTMGSIGNTDTQLRWTELGSGREYVFRLIISDPVKRVITGARVPWLYAEPNQ